jgi:hypothetical protein
MPFTEHLCSTRSLSSIYGSCEVANFANCCIGCAGRQCGDEISVIAVMWASSLVALCKMYCRLPEGQAVLAAIVKAVKSAAEEDVLHRACRLRQNYLFKLLEGSRRLHELNFERACR